MNTLADDFHEIFVTQFPKAADALRQLIERGETKAHIMKHVKRAAPPGIIRDAWESEVDYLIAEHVKVRVEVSE